MLPDFYHYRGNLEAPSFFWRSASYQTILSVSTLCRFFLFGLNQTEVHGLPRFLDLLKSRQDFKTRRRGLITVANHLCVLDEPLIWGALPLSYAAVHGYMNHRFSLGSHDILFKKSNILKHFFTIGQTLPVRRLAHDPDGGPLQSTMTEAVRLLSKISAQTPSFCPPSTYFPNSSIYDPYWPHDPIDPFSDLRIAPSYHSAPTDTHAYHAPSRYACNSYSWIHIFPEGMIHQSPSPTGSDYRMRYFKWGVSRLILEPPECPDLVPIFIEGTEQVMSEDRSWPRFVPRIRNKITITFGKEVDVETRFGDLRQRWKELVAREVAAAERLQVSKPVINLPSPLGNNDDLSHLTHSSGKPPFHPTPSSSWPHDEESNLGLIPRALWNHPEACEIRIQCTLRVREEILKLRRERGYPDEDPKAGVAETWAREGPKRRGRMEDGTLVGDA